MATQVILPKLGQTMEEGVIVEWLVSEGDTVGRGDVLFNLESDKAVLEVECRTKGLVRKILVEPGAKVPVGTPVAIIGAADEDISDLLGEGEAAEVEPEKGEAVPEVAPAPSATAAGAPQRAPGERIFASPRARKVARERGVSLAVLSGSGPNGRIVEKDVLAYLDAQPAATPLAAKEAARLGVSLDTLAPADGRLRAEDVRAAAAQPVTPVAPVAPAVPSVPAAAVAGGLTPMTGVRAIIADRMGTSAHTTARVTLQAVVDATKLVAMREELKAALKDELGFSVGYNDLLAVIVARCLVEFPYMNVRLEEGGIRQLMTVNLGMAVDSERGLLVPVIHGADSLSLKELAVRFRELVGRAREGKSMPDDLTGGTFTITNLGMFGVDAFTPIINLPECAILGVGRIRPEPAVLDGEIAVRQTMWLSLTFDHRLVDGAPAARFLQGITRYVESPYLLLA